MIPRIFVAQTEPWDIERGNMIGSLENISRAIAARRMSGPRVMRAGEVQKKGIPGVSP